MTKKKISIFTAVTTILAILAFFVAVQQTHVQADSKTLTFGATGTSFPTSYKDGDKLTGYDVEVANTIAKRLGYKSKWVTADFDGLFGQIDNGKINTIANDVAITPDRSNTYLFSNTYNKEATGVAVLKNSKYKTIKDLEGKKVAGVMGSNNVKSLQKYDSKIKVVTYESRDQAYSALTSGHVQGMVNSKLTLKATIKEKKLDWKVVSGSAASDKIAFPFKKDAQGKKLQKQFNKELKKMASDGTLTKISKKYYGYDTTK